MGAFLMLKNGFKSAFCGFFVNQAPKTIKNGS